MYLQGLESVLNGFDVVFTTFFPDAFSNILYRLTTLLSGAVPVFLEWCSWIFYFIPLPLVQTLILIAVLIFSIRIGFAIFRLLTEIVGAITL